jgi:hypothetical protein
MASVRPVSPNALNIVVPLFTLWLVESLLGKDHEISNYTAAIAKQRLSKQARFHGNNCSVTEERCFLCGPYRDVIKQGQLAVGVSNFS